MHIIYIVKTDERVEAMPQTIINSLSHQVIRCDVSEKGTDHLLLTIPASDETMVKAESFDKSDEKSDRSRVKVHCSLKTRAF